MEHAVEARLDQDGDRKRRSSRMLGVIAAMIAVHLAAGIHTASCKSVTHDELWHLPVGLANLRTGRFDVDTLNPPLTRMWAALPLWLAGVSGNIGAGGPDAGASFVRGHLIDFQRWYFWGRVFNLLLSAATATLLARWSWRMFGEGAALVTTLLYCTSPNVIAHASIVTPEGGLTLTFVATLYAFWEWARNPTLLRAVLLGVVLGAAQGTKFTAVLLYPVLAVLTIFCVNRDSGSWRRLVGHTAVAWLISLSVLNVAYRFQGTGRPLADYGLRSTLANEVRAVLGPLDQAPFPFPEDYVSGLDAQRTVMESQHPIFLDGVWSLAPFPDYYPKTLAYKLPHVFQMLFAVSIICWLCGACGPRRWRDQAVLWLPIVVLLGISATTAMQLGVRYVLPILPLMMLIAGQCGTWLGKSRAGRRIVFPIILLGCLGSLRHHPHHLAYFNEASGGPRGGRHRLLDSNLDWGQDLYLVRDFVAQHSIENLRLAYYGTLAPEDAGIDYALPPELTRDSPADWSLPAGWYAVSVNFVMGRPHVLHQPDGGAHSVDFEALGYFRDLEPAARLGYSIDVYHVEQTLTLEDLSRLRAASDPGR